MIFFIFCNQKGLLLLILPFIFSSSSRPYICADFHRFVEMEVLI